MKYPKILQYDIPDPDYPGSFIERYWSTTNTPILNEEGEVSYILHETKNVTEEVKAKNWKRITNGSLI